MNTVTPVSSISRQRPPKFMDFDVLRAEGIKHLEELATYIWTDFNAHDPGITILEVLCYALTDLGYRVNLPFEDLIASESGDYKSVFFEAAESLSVSPITELDYRKLLIDVKGVKNAWLEKGEGELPIYWKKFSDQYFERAFKYITAAEINSRADYLLKAFNLLVNDPTVNTNRLNHLASLYQNEITDDKINDFLALFTDEKDKKQAPKLIKTLICEDSEYTLTKIGDKAQQIKLNGLYKITLDLEEGNLDATEQRAKRILARARQRLHENRNLCEDFVAFKIVETIKVCLCLHLEIVPDADAEEVMAKAIFELQEFLTPTLKFHTLQQLLKEGRSGDQIYNGPLLEHGFLDDEEVAKADLRQEIFTSDLYKVLLAIPEIKSVKELKLKVGDETGFSSEWCYELKGKKPVIDPCCSNMTVSKGVATIKIKDKDVAPFLDYYHLVSRDISSSDIDKLPTPKGLYRPDLADFTSIQYDFPRTYYLGDEVPADTVGEQRLAQIKQLKAYLSFYDRLLANYLVQLSKVRDLLAVKPAADAETVFFSDLQMIPSLQELIQADSPEDFKKKLKNIATGEDSDEERREKILNHLIARFGEQFTDYTLQLFQRSAITGTYGEFEDYLEDKSNHLAKLPSLIGDRAKGYNYKLFRKDIPTPDVWNTTNISGLKKKVHSLLGIQPTSASLMEDPAYRVDLLQDMDKERRFYFIRLVQQNQSGGITSILLTSAKSYKKTDAERFREAVLEKIETDAAQELINSNNPSFAVVVSSINTALSQVQYQTKGSPNETITLLSDSLVKKDADQLLDRILQLVNPKQSNLEGFHLLEHILLRPNDDKDELLAAPSTCALNHPPVDPYSFWITVVLPRWTRRFQDGDFRKYFEQLFLAETPAHIAVCFLWIEDRVWMKRFEDAFEKWREALAKCMPDECKVTDFANNLIKILKEQPCPCNCFDRTALISSCEENVPTA